MAKSGRQKVSIHFTVTLNLIEAEAGVKRGFDNISVVASFLGRCASENSFHSKAVKLKIRFNYFPPIRLQLGQNDKPPFLHWTANEAILTIGCAQCYKTFLDKISIAVTKTTF